MGFRLNKLVNARNVKCATMAAGSHFRPMSSMLANQRCTPGLICQSLGSVHNATTRQCLPMRPAQRLRQTRSAVRPRPMAAVAAPEKTETSHVPPFQAWTTGAAIKKREDIKSILLLGAGPIVIGQVRHTRKGSCRDALPSTILHCAGCRV